MNRLTRLRQRGIVLPRVAILAVGVALAAAGPAGADVPAGFVVFDELEEQFSIAVPEGWHSHNQGNELTGEPGPAGRVIFSAEPIPGLHRARHEGTDYEIEYKEEEVNQAASEMAVEFDRGLVPSFIVDRFTLRRPRKGMTCGSFTKRFARSAALYQVSTDRGFSGEAEPIPFPDGFSLEPIAEIAGCRGFRLRAETTLGEPPGAVPWTVDVRLVSDGETLFMLIARGLAEHLPVVLETFEASLSTLELAKARR